MTIIEGSILMKKKILLVDDIKEFRALMQLLLSGSYEVVTAEDGREALKIIEEDGCKPDVIVTDLVMPEMDGYQLISRVRGSKEFKDTPIIVVSNYDKANKEELESNNIYSFLFKPFNTHELHNGLGRTLSAALAN